MSSFTDSALLKKLTDLMPSQQAIQTLSLWLIHHRKHQENIVKLWLRELQGCAKNKKLTFMFLANDVIQNSRRKGPEYGTGFAKVLLPAFNHIREVCSEDKKTVDSLHRILGIWLERNVYSEAEIQAFRKALGGTPSSGGGHAESSADRKRRHEEAAVAAKRARAAQRAEKEKEAAAKGDAVSAKEATSGTNGKETHVTLSPHKSLGEPPEPEELIRALQGVENSASSDVAVRQKIANLPLEYTELSMLSKLDNKEAALKLAREVSDAVTLLNEYNGRLCREMDDRKRLQVMLKDFAQEQRELVSQAEATVEEYSQKLGKVIEVQREIRNHLKNLPDVTTGELLAPLPSAGDLFSAH